ncbi:MAG: DUF1294 domain-containing protein [Clostridia bacterium]|nr:DUF1294 domain-containing protein [Clostridia bacterium]
MYIWLLYAYAGISLIALVAYGADKWRAKRNRRRTPESVLLGLGFFGGSVGALLGMSLFRHKTRHCYFWAVNLLGLIWQAGVLLWLWKGGVRLF